MPIAGSLPASSLAVPVPNSPEFVDDHRRLGDAARRLVERAQRGDALVDAGAEARHEAEDVLEAAVHDQVGGADIDQERRAVLRRGLAGGDADRALEAADIGRDALLVHLLDFGHADLDLGLAVAQQRLELGAAHRLDAARLVDVLDRHGAAEPALLAVEGDEAGHRMDHADLHRAGCAPPIAGKPRRAGGQRGRAGDEAATRNRNFPLCFFIREASYCFVGRDATIALAERTTANARRAMPKILSQAQVEQYRRDGFAFPAPVLDAGRGARDARRPRTLGEAAGPSARISGEEQIVPALRLGRRAGASPRKCSTPSRT